VTHQSKKKSASEDTYASTTSLLGSVSARHQPLSSHSGLIASATTRTGYGVLPEGWVEYTSPRSPAMRRRLAENINGVIRVHSISCLISYTGARHSLFKKRWLTPSRERKQRAQPPAATNLYYGWPRRTRWASPKSRKREARSLHHLTKEEDSHKKVFPMKPREIAHALQSAPPSQAHTLSLADKS
jgi:hypothetical protein